MIQADGTTHALQTVSGARNDGRWHMAVTTFDSTTIWVCADDAPGASSTSLAGTWHTGSTAGISIAALGTTVRWNGSLAHVAYWHGWVMPDTVRRWLYSIMAGG